MEVDEIIIDFDMTADITLKRPRAITINLQHLVYQSSKMLPRSYQIMPPPITNRLINHITPTPPLKSLSHTPTKG